MTFYKWSFLIVYDLLYRCMLCLGCLRWNQILSDDNNHDSSLSKNYIPTLEMNNFRQMRSWGRIHVLDLTRGTNYLNLHKYTEIYFIRASYEKHYVTITLCIVDVIENFDILYDNISILIIKDVIEIHSS